MATSSTFHRDARTQRAPETRKARCTPGSPSPPGTSPRPVSQADQIDSFQSQERDFISRQNAVIGAIGLGSVIGPGKSQNRQQSRTFADCRHKATINLEERHYVTLEATEQLIEASDPDWKLIIALVHFAGLRCPSEVLNLELCNIDWERGRMTVTSPRNERHGRPTRQVPLFKELRPYLEAAWDAAPDKAVYVLPERYRITANKPTGWRNCNLRTQFERIVERAGLEKWPRLFHAMRSSRESDLVKWHPLHIASRWLGNTPRIAEKHYLITSNADFDEASGMESEGGAVDVQKVISEPASVQNAVQHEPATHRIKKNPAETYTKSCGVM